MGTKENFRSGYVSVAGFPNVGKSTLLNRLIGSKLSIVSPKPQTTRSTMRGILTTDKAQIIFLDTAGIHRPKDKLGDYMVNSIKMTFHEADVIYLMVESTPPRSHDIDLIGQVKEAGKTTFLIINKVDLVKKDTLLPLIDHYRNVMEFDEIVPVSALKGDNVDRLLELTVSCLPEAPAYFPEDIVSDQIEREFISEFIREKVYLNTREEIPYSTAVVIEDMKEREGGGAYIMATIYLEKDSQKGIVIGSGGKMVKKIGEDARREIEQFLGYPVYLDLQVKVEKKWRGKTASLKKLGYR
jgi:GTP-binding protein Era